MAVSQNNRSIHRAQPARRFVNTIATATAPKTRTSAPRRQKVFQFPEVKGKVLESVEFASSSDYHAISLYFKNKTALDLIIDPCFTVHADYLDRKSGERRVLKNWPLIHSRRFRKR